MTGKQSSKLWLSLGFGLLCLIIAYTFVNYFSHNIPRFQMLFNSDSLYLPALFNNLVNESGAYNNWYLTPAPYFFPDMLLYFTAFTLTGDLYLAQFVFMIFQFFILIFCLYKINRLFFNYQQALINTTIVLALVYMFVLGEQTILAMLSAHHFGAYLSILMCLYLIIKTLNVENSQLRNSILLFLLVALTVASDKLFVIQFILPLALALALLWLYRAISIKTAFNILLVTLLASVVGLTLHYFLIPNPTGFTAKFTFYNLIPNLHTISGLVYKAFSQNYLYALIFIGFSLAVVFQLFAPLFTKSKHNSGFLFICIFVVFMSMTNIAALALSDLFITYRYLIPVFFSPLLLAPLSLKIIPSPPQFAVYLPRIALILALITLSINLIKRTINQNFYQDFYPDSIQCFDAFITQTNARFGIAHYWDAKRTALLSHKPITIAAYQPHIEPYNWISTSQWQHHRYDFALIRNQNYPDYQLNLIFLKQLSPKQKTSVFHCGLFDIHYFPQGLYTESGF